MGRPAGTSRALGIFPYFATGRAFAIGFEGVPVSAATARPVSSAIRFPGALGATYFFFVISHKYLYHM
jgi:hypothetical protein